MMLNQLAGKIQNSHRETSTISTKHKKVPHLIRFVEIIFIYTSEKLKYRTFTEVLQNNK